MKMIFSYLDFFSYFLLLLDSQYMTRRDRIGQDMIRKKKISNLQISHSQTPSQVSSMLIIAFSMKGEVNLQVEMDRVFEGEEMRGGERWELPMP